MSQCERIRDLIGGYLYGELTEVERCRFESHLQHCRTCHDEVEAAHSLIRRIPTDPEGMPAEAQQRVLRALQDRLAVQASGRRLRLLGSWGLAGAVALAMGVWIASQLLRGQCAQPPRHLAEVASSRPAPVLPAPLTGQQARRRQETPPPASTLESPSARPDERTVAAKMAPEHAPPLPVRVARAPAPALLAPRPIGVDDLTTTLEPLERE